MITFFEHPRARAINLRPKSAQSLFAAMVDAALQAEIVGMMTAAEKSGMLVSAFDRVTSLLEARGFSWTVPSILPHQVIVDPRNRSSTMICPVGSHQLGAKIVKQGWSHAKARSSMCVQLPTDASKREHALAKNVHPLGTSACRRVLVNVCPLLYLR